MILALAHILRIIDFFNRIQMGFISLSRLAELPNTGMEPTAHKTRRGSCPKSLVRQAKLGAPCRVRVPAEQGLTIHSYRVLQLRLGGENRTNQLKRTQREAYRPQGRPYSPKLDTAPTWRLTQKPTFLTAA